MRYRDQLAKDIETYLKVGKNEDSKARQKLCDDILGHFLDQVDCYHEDKNLIVLDVVKK